MTSAKPKNSLGEVNSFLLALQEEQQFADSLRLATTANAENQVLESQGFNADEIRKELQQVSFTDPVSSESVNLLSWMSINCKLDNGSEGISISAFVNALSAEGVREIVSQSAELQNFASMVRSLAGGSGSFTASRSKISIADRIGDAGETKEGDNDLNEPESSREALSAERNGIEPGERSVKEMGGAEQGATREANSTETTRGAERSVKEMGGAEEGSGRESSRDRMTGQSDEKSEGKLFSDSYEGEAKRMMDLPRSEPTSNEFDASVGRAPLSDAPPREAFDSSILGKDRVGQEEIRNKDGFWDSEELPKGTKDIVRDNFSVGAGDELVERSQEASRAADKEMGGAEEGATREANSTETTRGGERSVREMGGAKEGSGRESSRDKMTGQSDEKSEGDVNDVRSQTGRDSLESRGRAADDDDAEDDRDSFEMMDKERSANGGEKGRDDLEDDGIEFRDAFDKGMVSESESLPEASQSVKSADIDYARNVQYGYAKEGYQGQVESRKMYVEGDKVGLAQNKSKDIDQDYGTQTNVDRNLRGSSKARKMMGERDDDPTQSSGDVEELKADEQGLDDLSAKSPTGSSGSGDDGGDDIDLDD